LDNIIYYFHYLLHSEMAKIIPIYQLEHEISKNQSWIIAESVK